MGGVYNYINTFYLCVNKPNLKRGPKKLPLSRMSDDLLTFNDLLFITSYKISPCAQV